MPYNAEPGEVEYVTFTKACTHGDLVTESGYVGTAVKTQTPAADAPRTDRNKIIIGEKGLLLIDKLVEAPAAAPFAAPTKGTMVYIKASDNSLAAAATAVTSGLLNTGFLTVGKVAVLPGERGCPSNLFRINLRQKVA